MAIKKGDRIRLISMPDDPNPIPVGTEGTVRLTNDIDWAGDKYTQVSVSWDNGRSLCLVMPPDQVEVINERVEVLSEV